MTENPLNEALDELVDKLLAAEGLAAKIAVIDGAKERLISEDAGQVLLTRAGREPPSMAGAAIHADLVRACRDQGVENGATAFADALVNLWLRQSTLDDKAALLRAWGDPLLSDRMLEGIKNLAEQADQAGDIDEAARLRWHVQLLQRCRTRGVELGVVAQKATSITGITGKPKPGPKITDTEILLDELTTLAADNAPESWRRQAEILETLLSTLPAGGSKEIALTRARFGKRLATTLTKLLEAGILDAAAASAAFERAHLLNVELLNNEAGEETGETPRRPEN
ncbi:MAG: hypothetical protein ACI9MJ_002532 [Alphaproteobacteria bacterium]|jgi:hypothetical protein